jgi:hypothetical protein
MTDLINNVNEGKNTTQLFDDLFFAYGIDYILERLDSMMHDYLFSTDDKGSDRAGTYTLNMELRTLIITAKREKEARENDIKTIQTT